MDLRKTDKPNQEKRRAATFTVREDLIRQARALGLNASRAAEQGLEAEVKRVLEETWLKDSAKAVALHNKRVAEKGILITPTWARG